MVGVFLPSAKALSLQISDNICPHEDEKAQKNTFTRWINFHLEEHSSSGRIEDLFEDIRDGVLLCHLIEVLTGEALAVHKGRVSKRVHHIANLTTALAVLRRRGLELINNNAADIADGNPRIVLGLIWQIILHFQIETNMILLREWGWAATVAEESTSTSQPEVVVTAPSPTLSLKKGNSKTSSLSGSKTSIASGEKAPSSPLRQRIASFLTPTKKAPKLTTQPVKQSVEQVFLRWINAEIGDLVGGRRVENMDKQWRDGILFCALVSRWRPDVISMREVTNANPRDNLEMAFNLAHQHLGIRRLLAVEDMMIEKPDKRSVITYVSQFVRMFGERSPMQGREQHELFLSWLEATYLLCTRHDLNSQECSRIRREFIEHRPLFNTIIVTKVNYDVEELVEIEKKWDCIRETLEKYARRSERELPEPFASHATWLAGAEHILSRPLDLDPTDAKKTVTMLQKLISEHQKYLEELPKRRESFEDSVKHGGLGGRPVAPEFSEPLRARFIQIEEENEPRISTLRILITHYILLQYLQHIDEKIILWRTADSVTLLLRWIKEYTQLNAENPQAKCAGYINKLNLAMANDQSSKLDKEAILKTSNERAAETLKRFESLWIELKLIKVEWVEWETHVSQLEEIVEERRKNGIAPTLEDEQALAVIIAGADQLAPKLGASARLSNNQRLDVLTNSFKKLTKTTIKIGGRLVVELEPSTSEQASKITYSWEASDELLKVEMQLRDRIHRDSDSSERGPLEYRVEAFKNIRDKLIELERLNELYDKHSRDQVDTVDRNMIRHDMGTIIYGLQAGEYSSFVDLSCYAFVFDEYNQVPVNLTENVLSEDYVREIINRKKQILARREHNEDEIRESMRDMEECDRIIEGWQGKEIEELRATWNLKLSEFEAWHEMMQQVEVLSQTIQTRLDVTVIETISILKERSYEIRQSELGSTLRESLEQLATTSETSVQRHLQVLELSNEQDCPDAIEFLEEVGRQSISKLSAAVDDRYIYTLHVLRTKMELFRRLQNFCDAVKILRSQNTKWNSIKISQIDQVQSEIDTLIVRLDEEWTQDANQLRAELASIHGSFFQLEFDRLNEKLNMLIHEKDKLRELMVHRRHYLTAANELITDSKTDLTQRATSSDHPDDILRATDEVSKALEIKGEELRRLGELAEMNITDLVVVALILSFRRRQLGSDGEPDVEELRRALREIIARPLTEPRDVSPEAIVADILRMKDEKKRDEKTIDEIQATTLTDEQRASFVTLIEDYRRRADRHRIVFERLVLIYLDWLSREFDELEEEIGMTIQTSRADDLRRMNSVEWMKWKSDLVEIERQVGSETRKSLSAELSDLHRKQDSMEARINKYLTHSAKINAKLTQFEKWLKAIEEDIEQTEKQFEEPERSHRFGSLFEVALAKQRLVSKLERLNVTNKEEVLRLCDRYHVIMQKLTPFQSAVGLPLHVSTNLDRNGPFQSQISVSSIASSELERPESVMSLTSSIGVIPTDVTELSPFEAKITKLLRKIHNIEDSYLKGPKPIDAVKEDVKQLEKYRSRGAEILQQLSTSNIEDAEKEGLKHRFVLMLNNYDNLLGSIKKEIDDDEELRAENQKILAELSKAEQTLQNSPLEDLDISAELDHLQMQLDLVKVMCNKPRKYVECELIDSSREGSPQERRKRKKKVMVMVSNTITTIIHVVEERLEALDAPHDSAVQQKIVAVKENLRELDTVTVTPHPPSILSPVGTENRNDLDEVKRLAAEIDRAIDTASSMYEDSPADEDALKSAIHLLDDQKITLNHLHNVLDGIPIEKEQDRIEAVDIASSVGEKLGNLKSVVEEVYDEIVASNQHPEEPNQAVQHVDQLQESPSDNSNWETDEFTRKPPVISDDRIELKTDPSAIDKFEVRTDEDPIPKIIELFGQLQTAVDEASPLACEGTSNVDSLQTASDKLTKQDKTMKKIHAILENIDDPIQKPAIIESLDRIKEQIDLARDNINRQIDNLNYNQTPVVAPKESTKTPLAEIEEAIKQATASSSDELCNTEKLLNARQILSNVKPQVDAVEAGVWSNPESIETVQPVLEQYSTLITNIDQKLSQEIDVPINDPSRQDLVQQLQDVITECEDAVVDSNDIIVLEESKTKLENAKPLLDQIGSNVEKLTREQSPDVSDAIDALSNVHQQYNATILAIEEKIEELNNPVQINEEQSTLPKEILLELEVISNMPAITIDLSMLDGIEQNLSTLSNDEAEEIRAKINELRQKKEFADQSEQILEDLNAFAELPAITLDIDLLNSIEEGLVALPEENREKIRNKISELRTKKENADQAEAVLQELQVVSDLPSSTIDLEMLKGIEENLNSVPEEEADKIREKLKELRDKKQVSDQTEAVIQELNVIKTLPSSTIDLNMLQGIEDNLHTIPSEDAEKIRLIINDLREQKEKSDQSEAILHELNVISEMPSSTIDLDMLKSIEDGLSSLPNEEASKIQTEIDSLRNRKQNSDKIENLLQDLEIKPPVSIDLDELKKIENSLIGLSDEEKKLIQEKISKLKTEKSLADHAENYLIELKKIEEMPITSIGDQLLATIEDQITQMPSEYQSIVRETLDKLRKLKEEDEKYSAVYDDLEKISKLPSKEYDNQLLDDIDGKLQILPKEQRGEAQDKIEEIKITKADIVAEIASLDQLPVKEIDDHMLNSIEEKLPTIPSDSSDQLQIAIGKLRAKKQENRDEGKKIFDELVEIEKMPAETIDENVLKTINEGLDQFEKETSDKIKEKIDELREKKNRFEIETKKAEGLLQKLEELSQESPISLTEDRLAPFLRDLDTVPACFVDKIRNKVNEINKAHEEAVDEEKEELKEQLIQKTKEMDKTPISILSPEQLTELETRISESLPRDEAEPLLAKIQELRDAKKADDEARSAAHDNLVTLEKQAEDVTAKESAKKKKKDKKKSPQEMIDELKAKVVEAKELIPKIEEAAKNEHLPADDKPKAEQLVSNLETFIKDVETQVSEKQDELDKLNNANDAIRRLGDALDDAEKTVVPSNVAALKEFKDRIAPHLATLVEAVKEVPVSVEDSAAALRDRAAKFVTDLEKNIEKTGDDEKRAEELKSNVGNAVNNVDDVVSKYQNQTQPLDVAKEDANKLKTAVEQLTKLAESGDKIDPQVAKDIKDSKTKAKELLQALEKAIPQEDAIRREQAEINDRLNSLERELANVDEFKPEDALPIVDKLATDTTALKAVTDSNNEKAVTPSSLISHEDLVAGLPEKVFQLQHAIDDKKQALNKTAAVNEIAPKLQLVSQQLQSVPQEVPASLDEQKQLLEEVENQKHNLENLLANLPENDPAADELRQKSQWDLSRLKDLLKQLGSAVGDKLAALAAFNAARKNAEDALLDITREDGADDSKSPDELIDDLTKKEETVAKLRETVAGVKPDELDEKERAEYNDLLARLATAADVLKTKRAELEQAIKDKADEKSLHDAVDRSVSRLV
uniref:Calponin-homology (CH) domain-containing protein n=2 Tax=Caenorhabditis tropicalis TaxID=1561998 RepID=A0A1I7TJX3_9PELO